jgi:hypothetical protein
MPRLNRAKIMQYAERGYVVPDFQLPAARVKHLQEALEKLIRDNPNVRPEQLISVHVRAPDGATNGEGIRGSEVFLELARDAGILDCVESVLGPDIVLWGCAMFCKPAGDGMAVPMHQDGHYWPIKPLATCTVWVAIEDSDRGNGCLQVVPGSHANKQVFGHETKQGHVALSEQVVPGAYDETRVVDVELRAGQMSMHDVYLLHGSNANASTRRRSGLALRYMPASSLWDRAHVSPDASELVVDYASRPLWLLRGRDASGLNDFDAGHFG